MDRSDIEEMAKDLIPLAERTNAGEAIMTTDYDDKWEFFMGFRKKKKYRTQLWKESIYEYRRIGTTQGRQNCLRESW